jgi:hypothetical protein
MRFYELCKIRRRLLLKSRGVPVADPDAKVHPYCACIAEGFRLQERADTTCNISAEEAALVEEDKGVKDACGQLIP